MADPNLWSLLLFTDIMMMFDHGQNDVDDDDHMNPVIGKKWLD